MQEQTIKYTTEETQQENPEQLMRWMGQFVRQYKSAFSRKERCEKLMRRKSAKKWAPEKTALMVRRMMVANKEVEQAQNALDQLTHRLSQLGIEVGIMSRSEMTS